MPRLAGLDRLRGLALWGMLLHHLLGWFLGGDHARHLLGGADGFALTDLAAPAFAIAVGASAQLTASRLRARRLAGLGRCLRRWLVVAAWGVAIGASIGSGLAGPGVLETLAIVGIVTTVLAVAGMAAPTWTALAVVLAVAAGPIVELVDGAGGWWEGVFAGTFPLASYLALAAAGAALGAAQQEGERPLLLAATTVAVGLVVLAAAISGMASSGVAMWPVERYPGGAAFVVPGVLGTVAVWAALAAVGDGVLVRLLAIAGRATLPVFVAHYGVRLVLHAGGWTGRLHGWAWGVVAALIATAFALAPALAERYRRRARRAPPAGDPLVASPVGIVTSR